MKRTRVLSIRVNQPLYDAVHRAAAKRGLPVADWLRQTLGEITDTPVGDHGVGLAGADEQTRRRVASAGMRARRHR